eukprot:2900486-Alexandrium_andersonii.AAC.1
MGAAGLEPQPALELDPQVAADHGIEVDEAAAQQDKFATVNEIVAYLGANYVPALKLWWAASSELEE